MGKRLFASRLGDSEPLMVPEEQQEPLKRLSGSESDSSGLGGESNTGDWDKGLKVVLLSLKGGGEEEGGGMQPGPAWTLLPPYVETPLKPPRAWGIRGARNALRSCSGQEKELRHDVDVMGGGGGVREGVLSTPRGLEKPEKLKLWCSLGLLSLDSRNGTSRSSCSISLSLSSRLSLIGATGRRSSTLWMKWQRGP